MELHHKLEVEEILCPLNQVQLQQAQWMAFPLSLSLLLPLHLRQNFIKNGKVSINIASNTWSPKKENIYKRTHKTYIKNIHSMLVVQNIHSMLELNYLDTLGNPK